MTTLVTRDSLRDLIQNPKQPEMVQHVVGKALISLFERQTKDEQSSNSTTKHNGIGFAGCDAKGGSLTAKFYLKHKRLEQWMIDNWIKINTKTGYPRLCKYHAQLNEIALLKQDMKHGR